MKIFWPLVNMRIQYPGKTHWVQKSPRLYRWTW
jgi:carotenoid 1,2-hydratase